MIKKLFPLITILLGFLLLPLSKVNASSIGVSPSQITIDALKPGLTTTRQITISRGETATDETFLLTADSSESGLWLTFLPGKEVTLAKGQTRANVTVNIAVPEGVAYKRYLPKIRIVEKTQQSATGVSIQSGLIIGLDLLVTDKDVVKLNVLSAKVLDSFLGANLNLSVVFQNEGNVKTAPSKVALAIRTSAGKDVAQLENTVIEPIDPQSTTERVVAFDTKSLPVGEYLAKLTVFDTNNKLIYSYDLFFRVIEKPSQTAEKPAGLTAMLVILSMLVLIGCLAVVIVVLKMLLRVKKSKLS